MSQEPDHLEQLSALMDGELPEAEARFLLRRLEHDAQLRGAWERMQLASQCLRAQPWQPMAAGFADRVASQLGNAGPQAARRPLLRWAIAASVLALGLALAPRMLQTSPAPDEDVADVAAPAPERMVPSPASADLVALRPPAARATPAPARADLERTDSAPLVAAVERSERASPLPLDSASPESPADFPLVDNGEERSWPRSELAAPSSDPAIEAYLVRHNQMMANDGLGGFVPYVDVVSNSQPGGGDAAAPQETDGK